MIDKKIIIIVGPTAVGKTTISIKIANRLTGEIISADSMQIYKYMNIGTAKPSPKERRGIKHHLIDIVEPDDNEFSVAVFQKEARDCIDHILKRKHLPILVGGTGLYINSIIYQMDFANTVSNIELRNKLEKDAEEFGKEYVYKKLEALDPRSAKRIHKNNVKRVIRAIEIYHETGKSMGDFSRDLKLDDKYNKVIIGLTRNRQELYDRINSRVDSMVVEGLIEEVKNLLLMGYNENMLSLQGLGYKEVIGYLKGEYSLERAIEILKRDTRRYAKRQLTWFRRLDDIKWYNISEYPSEEKLTSDIIKYIEGY